MNWQISFNFQSAWSSKCFLQRSLMFFFIHNNVTLLGQGIFFPVTYKRKGAYIINSWNHEFKFTWISLHKIRLKLLQYVIWDLKTHDVDHRLLQLCNFLSSAKLQTIMMWNKQWARYSPLFLISKLTLPISCISESCIKVKVFKFLKLNFYFHSSFWNLEAPQRSMQMKI